LNKKINKTKEKIEKLIIIAKTIEQRNSLEQAINYVTNVFKHYYINLVQQSINCVKKLFELKLNQIINCLDNLDKTKCKNTRKNSLKIQIT